MSSRDLYSSAELLSGFDADDPMSYVRTWDFKQYVGFMATGGAVPCELSEGLRRATHDATIADALRRYLANKTAKDGKPPAVVGVMGGHSLGRQQAAYALIADLARSITRAGYLIATGGGPGAMEAAHLGAYCANAEDKEFASALARLAAVQVRALPDLRGLLDARGALVPGKEGVIGKAHAWLAAAVDARACITAQPGESLAIPTWLYGQEPTMPFASGYAKYFQDSIREDALISEARAGTLYAQGGGGTLREVFEDLEGNYYQDSPDKVVPMIFVDPDGYWQCDAQFNVDGTLKTPGIRLDNVVPAILFFAAPKAYRDAFRNKAVFTTDIKEILDTLAVHKPVAESKLQAMLTVGTAALESSRWQH